MSLTEQHDTLDNSSLPLAEQVVRLQALLEASRAVHSTIELTDVLQQSSRIAVRELELEGALFVPQRVTYGNMPAEPDESCPRFELMSRDGKINPVQMPAAPSSSIWSVFAAELAEECTPDVFSSSRCTKPCSRGVIFVRDFSIEVGVISYWRHCGRWFLRI